MPALSGLIGLILYHPFVPVAVCETVIVGLTVRARDRRRPGAVSADPTRSLGSNDGHRLEHVARVGRGPFWVDSGRPDPVRCSTGSRNYTVSP